MISILHLRCTWHAKTEKDLKHCNLAGEMNIESPAIEIGCVPVNKTSSKVVMISSTADRSNSVKSNSVTRLVKPF